MASRKQWITAELRDDGNGLTIIDRKSGNVLDLSNTSLNQDEVEEALSRLNDHQARVLADRMAQHRTSLGTNAKVIRREKMLARIQIDSSIPKDATGQALTSYHESLKRRVQRAKSLVDQTRSEQEDIKLHATQMQAAAEMNVARRGLPLGGTGFKGYLPDIQHGGASPLAGLSPDEQKARAARVRELSGMLSSRRDRDARPLTQDRVSSYANEYEELTGVRISYDPSIRPRRTLETAVTRLSNKMAAAGKPLSDRASLALSSLQPLAAARAESKYYGGYHAQEEALREEARAGVSPEFTTPAGYEGTQEHGGEGEYELSPGERLALYNSGPGRGWGGSKKPPYSTYRPPGMPQLTVEGLRVEPPWRIPVRPLPMWGLAGDPGIGRVTSPFISPTRIRTLRDISNDRYAEDERAGYDLDAFSKEAAKRAAANYPNLRADQRSDFRQMAWFAPPGAQAGSGGGLSSFYQEDRTAMAVIAPLQAKKKALLAQDREGAAKRIKVPWYLRPNAGEWHREGRLTDTDILEYSTRQQAQGKKGADELLGLRTQGGTTIGDWAGVPVEEDTWTVPRESVKNRLAREARNRLEIYSMRKGLGYIPYKPGPDELTQREGQGVTTDVLRDALGAVEDFQPAISSAGNRTRLGTGAGSPSDVAAWEAQRRQQDVAGLSPEQLKVNIQGLGQVSVDNTPTEAGFYWAIGPGGKYVPRRRQETYAPGGALIPLGGRRTRYPVDSPSAAAGSLEADDAWDEAMFGESASWGASPGGFRYGMSSEEAEEPMLGSNILRQVAPPLPAEQRGILNWYGDQQESFRDIAVSPDPSRVAYLRGGRAGETTEKLGIGMTRHDYYDTFTKTLGGQAGAEAAYAFQHGQEYTGWASAGENEGGLMGKLYARIQDLTSRRNAVLKSTQAGLPRGTLLGEKSRLPRGTGMVLGEYTKADALRVRREQAGPMKAIEKGLSESQALYARYRRALAHPTEAVKDALYAAYPTVGQGHGTQAMMHEAIAADPLKELNDGVARLKSAPARAKSQESTKAFADKRAEYDDWRLEQEKIMGSQKEGFRPMFLRMGDVGGDIGKAFPPGTGIELDSIQDISYGISKRVRDAAKGMGRFVGESIPGFIVNKWMQEGRASQILPHTDPDLFEAMTREKDALNPYFLGASGGKVQYQSPTAGPSNVKLARGQTAGGTDPLWDQWVNENMPGWVPRPGPVGVMEQQAAFRAWRQQQFSGGSATPPGAGATPPGGGAQGAGSGAGGPPPPDEPPFDYDQFVNENQGESDEKGVPGDAHTATHKQPPKEEMKRAFEAAQRGENVLAALYPGFGKTEIARDVGTMPGLHILLSPLTKLNQQLAGDLEASGVPAVYLPGLPQKYDPKTQSLAEYKGQMKTYNDAIKRAQAMGRQGSGVLVMSPEKLVTAMAEPDSRLGKLLASAGARGKLGRVVWDEIQEFMSTNRPMFRQVANTIKGLGMPITGMGGTVNKNLEQELQKEIGFDTVIRKDATYQQTRFRFTPTSHRQEEIAARGAQFLRDAKSNRPWAYGATTAMVEQVYTGAKNLGVDARQYHKGEGIPTSEGGIGRIPEADLTKAWEDFKGGDPNAPVGMSSSIALGLGMNVPGISEVASVDVPFTGIGGLAQIASRIREQNLPAGQMGEFNLFANPNQIARRGKSMLSDMTALTAEDFGASYIAASRQPLSGRWQEDMGTLEDRVGRVLSDRGKSRVMAGTVLSMLGTPGAGAMGLKLVPGVGGGEGHHEIAFQADTSNPAAAIKMIQEGQFKSGSEEGLGYKEFLNKEGFRQGREFTALGQLLGRAAAYKDEPEGDIRGGRFLKAGMKAFQRGGIEGFEKFVDQALPEAEANLFMTRMRKAGVAFEEQSKVTSNVTQAQTTLVKAIQTAVIPLQGSTNAWSIAQSKLAASGMGAAVSAAMGGPGGGGVWQGVAGNILAQGPPVPGGPGGAGGGRGPKQPADFTRTLEKLGWTTWNIRRIWQMTGGQIGQWMGEYAQNEQATNALLASQGHGVDKGLGTGISGFNVGMQQMQAGLGKTAFGYMQPFLGQAGVGTDWTKGPLGHGTLASMLALAGIGMPALGVGALTGTASVALPLGIAAVAAPAAKGIEMSLGQSANEALLGGAWTKDSKKAMEYLLGRGAGGVVHGMAGTIPGLGPLATQAGRLLPVGEEAWQKGLTATPEEQAEREKQLWKTWVKPLQGTPLQGVAERYLGVTEQGPTEVTIARASIDDFVDKLAPAVGIENAQLKTILQDYMAAGGQTIETVDREAFGEYAARAKVSGGRVTSGAASMMSALGVPLGSEAYRNMRNVLTAPGIPEAQMERWQQILSQSSGPVAQAFQQYAGITEGYGEYGKLPSPIEWGTGLPRGTTLNWRFEDMMRRGGSVVLPRPMGQSNVVPRVTTGSLSGSAASSSALPPVLQQYGATQSLVERVANALPTPTPGLDFRDIDIDESLLTRTKIVPQKPVISSIWGTTGIDVGGLAGRLSGSRTGKAGISNVASTVVEAIRNATPSISGAAGAVANVSKSGRVPEGTGGPEVVNLKPEYSEEGMQEHAFAKQEESMRKNWDYQKQIWGFEDQRRSLKNQWAADDYTKERQMAVNRIQWQKEDLGFAKQQAEMGHRHFQENMTMQRELWTTQTAWRKEDLAVSHGQTVQKMAWQKEEFEASKHAREIQFGWQQEDYERNIRYATGREKMELIRNRDRSAIMNNLKRDEEKRTEGQMGTQAQWENQQYKKQVERNAYQEDWDTRHFELQIKQEEERFNLTMAHLAAQGARLDAEAAYMLARMDEEERRRKVMAQLEIDQAAAEKAHATEMHEMDVNELDFQRKAWRDRFDAETQIIDSRRTMMTEEALWPAAQLTRLTKMWDDYRDYVALYGLKTILTVEMGPTTPPPTPTPTVYTCPVPGCGFTAATQAQVDQHYATKHREIPAEVSSNATSRLAAAGSGAVLAREMTIEINVNVNGGSAEMLDTFITQVTPRLKSSVREMWREIEHEEGLR